jgi:hypothetical protein
MSAVYEGDPRAAEGNLYKTIPAELPARSNTVVHEIGGSPNLSHGVIHSGENR